MHVSVRCFVRLIGTGEDYSRMGGWLWKDYEDGNIVLCRITTVKQWMEAIPPVCHAKDLKRGIELRFKN